MGFTSGDTAAATLDWGDVPTLDGATQVLWTCILHVQSWDANWEEFWQKDDANFNSSGNGWQLGRWSNNDDLLVVLRTSTGVTQVTIDGSATPPFTFQVGWWVDSGADSWRGFKNGSQVSSGSGVGNALVNITNAMEIRGNDNQWIAECAMWTGISSARATEIMAAMGNRYSPAFYPNGLKFYAPLIRDDGSNANDIVGGETASWPANSATEIHPRIIYPGASQIITAPAAAGKGVGPFTELSVMGLPGMIHSFLAKDPAGAAAEVFFENRHPIEHGMKPQSAAGLGGVLID